MLNATRPPQFGKYLLLDVLGMGGMATVYLASLEGLGGFKRKCALKVIHPHLTQDESYIRWFINEARLGGFLQHQHIVQTLEFGEEQGCLYLAMEYVEGVTLSRILQHADSTHAEARRDKIPLATVGELLEAILKGLAYAHQATDADDKPLRLVHRDLKPANILVGKHGAIKIADFGVARADSNLAMTADTGIVKGTARYMSPEQARGTRRIDQRSDLFSVGAMAYELLMHSKLYAADNAITVHQMALEADHRVALAQLARDPERGDFAPFIRKALAKDPDARFQSAHDMLAALERLRPVLMSGPSLMPWLSDTKFSWSGPARPRTISVYDILEPPATPTHGKTPRVAGSALAETEPEHEVSLTDAGLEESTAQRMAQSTAGSQGHAQTNRPPREAMPPAGGAPPMSTTSLGADSDQSLVQSYPRAAPSARSQTHLSASSIREVPAIPTTGHAGLKGAVSTEAVGEPSPRANQWGLYGGAALAIGVGVWITLSSVSGVREAPAPSNPVALSALNPSAVPAQSVTASSGKEEATPVLAERVEPTPLPPSKTPTPQKEVILSTPKPGPVNSRPAPVIEKTPRPEVPKDKPAPSKPVAAKAPSGYLTFNVPDLGTGTCQLDNAGKPRLRWLNERVPEGPHSITCRDEGWEKSFPLDIQAGQLLTLVCRRSEQECRTRRLEPVATLEGENP